MIQLLRDIRHSWRTIRRAPMFATVVVLSLGVGIGVNTAIFSWIQALTLQPLPGATSVTRLQRIEARTESGGYPGVSWPEYRDLAERLHTFRDLFAFRLSPFNIGEPDALERRYGLLVSGNYFSALDLRPAAGRFMRPDEIAEPVVVISYDFWQTHFRGSADAMTQTLHVNGKPLTVIGVTPPGFQGTVIGLDFDVWMPVRLAPVVIAGSGELENRGFRGYQLMGALVPGASRAAAQSDVDAVMQQLAHDFPATNEGIRGEVAPFWQAPRGPQQFLIGALAALQAVMLLLLLAVCGNTANLVLARASARQQEIGVRLALGAGRWQVANLIVIESLMLALAGALVGVAIAVWGTDALRAVPLPQAFPIRFQTRIDGLSLVFAALLALACGLAFGVPAAVQLTRVGPQQALRAGARTATRSRMRDTLMAVEVALALVVLIAAAYFFKSFNSTRGLDPGFRRDGVWLAAYDLSGRNLTGAAIRDEVFRLLDAVRMLPDVESAAVASSVPLDIHGLPLRSFALDGRTTADGRPERALVNTVTPGYFATMGIAITEGTDFAPLNDAAAPPQAIVNETFARLYFAPDLPAFARPAVPASAASGGGEPGPTHRSAHGSKTHAVIGRQLESGGRRYTIAGVVKDSVYESFGEQPKAIVYYSYRDRPAMAGEIHVRGREARIVQEVRRAVRDVDRALPLYNTRSLNDHIETNLIFERVPARMFTVLGPLLLALAAIGIYAVVSYTVSLRTREIGVRLALGAPTARLIAEVVGQSLVTIGVGALAGWLFAFVMTLDVVMGSIDAAIFAAVPAVLLLVAAVACWLPARRAAAIDPVHALRQIVSSR